MAAQGFVNLVQTSAATGGNVVADGSHKAYAELATMHATQDHRIPMAPVYESHPELFATGRCVIAHLEAGDVFLWDDRTAHCNAPGVGGGAAAAADAVALLRAVVYVSFSPRAQTTPEALGYRRQMVQCHIGTGHAARLNAHRNMTEELGAAKAWAPGDVDVVEPEAKWSTSPYAGPSEFVVANPAVLSAYQLSLVG